jgi:hypothetical protein
MLSQIFAAVLFAQAGPLPSVPAPSPLDQIPFPTNSALWRACSSNEAQPLLECTRFVQGFSLGQFWATDQCFKPDFNFRRVVFAYLDLLPKFPKMQDDPPGGALKIILSDELRPCAPSK